MIQDYYLELIYLVYGLAFYSAGLATLIKLLPARYSSELLSYWWLVGFGLLHGALEWSIGLSIVEARNPLNSFNLLLNGTSLACLLGFGLFESRILIPTPRHFLVHGACSITLAIAILAVFDAGTADTVYRYLFGMTGAVLAAYAVLRNQRMQDGQLKYNQRISAYLATAAFMSYALLVVLVPPADYFPANVINSTLVTAWANLPIEIPRTLCAVFMGVSIVVLMTGRDVVEQSYLRENILAATQELSASQASLRSAQELSDQLLDASPTFIVIQDREGRITRVNQAFSTFIGRPASGLVGSPTWLLASMQDEEERARQQQLFNEAATTPLTGMETHPADECESAWSDAGGNRRIVSWKYAWITDDAGFLTYQIASGRDVTEQRTAYQEMAGTSRLLLDTQRLSQVGSWELDLASEDLTWTSEIRSIFELPADMPASMEAIWQRIHPEDADRLREKFTESLATRQPYTVTHRLLFDDGRTKFILNSCETEYDEAGSPIISRGTVQDISEITALQEELDYQRSLSEALLEVAPDIILLLDVDSTIRYANPYFERLSGYSLAEIQGRNWFDTFILEEDAEQIQQIFEDAVHGTHTRGNINAIRLRSGETRQIEWYDDELVSADLSIAGIVAVGRDVTDRLDTEKRRARNEGQLRRAELLANIGHYSFDADGNAQASEGLLRIWGLNTEKDPDIATAMAMIHDEDRPLVEAAMQALLEDLAPFDIQYRFIRDDGREVFVRSLAEHDPDASTDAKAFFGSMIDITEHKRTEQDLKTLNERLEYLVDDRTADLISMRNRLEYLISSSPVVIYAADRSSCHEFQYISPNVSSMTGLPPDAFLDENSHWQQHIHPEDSGSFSTRLSDLEAAGSASHDFRFLHMDGTCRWIHEEVSLQENAFRNQFEIVGAWVDVTERRKAELALEEAREEMIKQQKLATIGQVTATVNHELRNPLATIRTSTYSLGKKLGDQSKDILDTLDRIERSVQRCDNVIAEVLDFARTRPREKQQITIDSWLRSIIDEQEPPEWLTVNFVPGLDTLTLTLDTDRVRRAIINIYTNALQAMEHTQRDRHELCIRTSRHDDRIGLEFTDTGAGMSDEAIQNAFEPLFSTKTYGVGLGLVIVKQVMEEENGGIDISHAESGGTRVTLWFEPGRHKT